MDSSSWQTEKTSIKERVHYMYSNSLFSDIEFLITKADGTEVRFPAHKFVLSVSSPVFEAMFFGNLAESGPTVRLPDCTVDGFQELLRYLYCDQVVFTGKNVLDVLYLSKKYIISHLIEKCWDYIERVIGYDDVFHVLPKAITMGEERVQGICWELVDIDTAKCLASDAFLEVSKELLCDLLKRESLSIPEVKLFRAVNRWAEKKVEEKGMLGNPKAKREVLGEDLIYLIRVPLMTAMEFVEVLSNNILNEVEIQELSNHHVKKEALTRFNAEPRPGLEPIDELPLGKANSSDVSGLLDGEVIRFTVNSELYLTGIKLFGEKILDNFNINLMILNGNNEVVSQCNFGKTFLSWVAGRDLDEIALKLPEPVRVTPGLSYCVKAHIQGPVKYDFGITALPVVYGQCTTTSSPIRFSSTPGPPCKSKSSSRGISSGTSPVSTNSSFSTNSKKYTKEPALQFYERSANKVASETHTQEEEGSPEPVFEGYQFSLAFATHTQEEKGSPEHLQCTQTKKRKVCNQY